MLPFLWEAKMATHLKTNGNRVDLGKDPDLKTCQEVVGGYIEGVAINGGYMYVNEEGLFKSLEPNPVASMLARRPIVGDVVLLDPDEVK
jgi:hypothetical protein